MSEFGYEIDIQFIITKEGLEIAEIQRKVVDLLGDVLQSENSVKFQPLNSEYREKYNLQGEWGGMSLYRASFLWRTRTSS